MGKFKFSAVHRAIISIFFLCLLLWILRDSIGEVVNTLKETNVTLFSITAILFLGAIYMISYRLKRLFAVNNINMSLKAVFYLNMMGMFFNNFMPTAVGGDLVKAYYAAKRTDKKAASISAIFLDRMIGMFAVVFIAAIMLIIYNKNIENKVIVWSILMMTGFCVIMICLLFKSGFTNKFNFLTPFFKLIRINEKLKKLDQAVKAYKEHKNVLVGMFNYSIGTQLLMIGIIYLLSRSIYVNVPISSFFLLIPIITAVSMVPSLNGLGVREGGYVYFFGSLIGKDKAFALSILYLGLLIIASIVGGLIYLFYNEHIKPKKLVEDASC